MAENAQTDNTEDPSYDDQLNIRCHQSLKQDLNRLARKQGRRGYAPLAREALERYVAACKRREDAQIRRAQSGQASS